MTETAKNQNPVEELIVDHFDGSLNVEQETELAEALAASAASKQLFLSYMRLEGRLHSLGRDGFLRDPGARPEGIIQQPTDITPVDQDHNQHSPSMRSRFLAVSTSVAVCAAVILMLTSGLWPSPVNANSVLRKAQQAAAHMVDRAYRVTISGGNAYFEAATQELMINIRGGRHFVIQPVHGSYAMGSDGIDYWLSQDGGPVWITKDYRTLPSAIGRRIPNRGMLKLADSRDELLMMPMPSLLSRIEDSYDVELVESFDPAERHLRATLRSRRGSRAHIIDFWADADSGVVLRAELKWENGRLARFEQVDAPTLSDQWYHYSQHAPDRPVRRVDATDFQ
ncbi:MAG: hypothetical protein P8K08_10505 [Fuerstiella sp.]|jgi:hypothetical protein|nr:hypothetical protein [Fuerstiella sp.]